MMNKKSFDNSMIEKTAQGVTSEDLELINKFTLKELKAEDVYVFNTILCNNDVDRDFEKFSVASLNKMAELFVGKTGISDHMWSSEEQKCRIFKTWVEAQDGQITADGEQLYCLKARAYMLNSDSNRELIANIDAGIKKEVSVACSMSNSVCSICGSEEYCEHIQGCEYDGKHCFRILENPQDAYEFSFVAVPAQKGAGVTKSFADVINEKIAKGRDFRQVSKFYIAKKPNDRYTVEGYAMKFDRYKLCTVNGVDIYEEFDRSCFKNTDMSDVIMQYDHSGAVYARIKNGTLKLSVDNVGLFIQADLSKTEKAKSLFEDIQKGMIDEMSWSFKKGDYYFDKETRTIVHKTIEKIYDVSAVSIPANENTEIYARSFCEGVIENVKKEFQEHQRLIELINLKIEI